MKFGLLVHFFYHCFAACDMRFFLILYLTIFSFSAIGQQENNQLLKQLDLIIADKPLYAKTKELRLDSLKALLLQEGTLSFTYQVYNNLFAEYKHYNLDSALHIAKRKNRLASQMNDVQLQYEAQMNMAEMLGKMGMYKEIFDIMARIKINDLEKSQWPYYFHLFHSIYSLLWQNALSQEEKKQYKTLILQYKDSLLNVIDSNTLAYKLLYSGKLSMQSKYQEALGLMNQALKQPNITPTENATIAFALSELNEKLGRTEEEKHFLTITAIADLKGAVKSYIALRKLATLLYKEGDLDRAYLYIKCSMEDATFCKARFRMIEISEALPIIVAAYDKKMQEEKKLLFKYLILISLLSLVLMASIVLIYLQIKKISASKKHINAANEELKAINAELNELNGKLVEADHVKEIYIGYVFNLCSAYINKLENYRTTLYKMLKGKEIGEALRVTADSSLATNELKEFFQNFDAVFLNLYPNFIEEFNAMLHPGEQIIPRSGDILTPELRVFALVRLGVADSSKIADFLHYSPQTVYNYKLKVKNKVAVSKDEFSSKIQQIGK
jgi:hypothetical protein